MDPLPPLLVAPVPVLPLPLPPLACATTNGRASAVTFTPSIAPPSTICITSAFTITIHLALSAHAVRRED
jgi:hypothetical protein